MSTDSDSDQIEEPPAPDPNLASLTVREMSFSDETTVELQSGDIIVLVGPNNAGKSATLRDIEEQLQRPKSPSPVVSSMKVSHTGSLQDVEAALIEHSYQRSHSGQVHYGGDGYSINFENVRNSWPNNYVHLVGFFCRRLRTETRISDSSPASSYNALTEGPSRPIQALYADSEMEDRVSGYFKKAFDQDLVVMRLGGNQIPLMVGSRLQLQPGENTTQKSYLERQNQTVKALHDQGDGMRSFASVILEMLASLAPSILLLDEPEAFLHPPQARLLGEFLARERRPNSQLFIATHSPDVLTGLLNEAPDQLRVIRLQRSGDINKVKELDKDSAKAIAGDPLMKYSSVLSGIFHQRAIICESDADCMFYQTLLALPNVNAGPHPDVLFLHGSGKHRIATMATALRAVDVPVDVVVDIDLIREKTTFQALVVALGGDWNELETSWNTVKSAIENRAPLAGPDEIVDKIRAQLDRVAGQTEFPKSIAEEIRSELKNASPWAAVKKSGLSAIPSGHATVAMNQLVTYLSNLGIWVVPVGEIESFCKSIGGHGPKWVQQVIEERDLSTDPELKPARDFVKAIWSHRLR